MYSIIMDRLIIYWHRYTPVSPEASQLFQDRIVHYRRNEYFMRPNQHRPYWCVLLTGLACGYVLDASGQRCIQWFASEMQGFTGVKHLYTPRKANHYIQFLEDSTLLCMPASAMRTAKEHYPEVSELLHVLKQKYIDQQEAHIFILQQPNAYERYIAFREKFPELIQRTTIQQQCDFINISERSLNRAKKQYLQNRS